MVAGVIVLGDVVVSARGGVDGCAEGRWGSGGFELGSGIGVA
jgi:hypothetical protein